MTEIKRKHRKEQGKFYLEKHTMYLSYHFDPLIGEYNFHSLVRNRAMAAMIARGFSK